jgi:nucleotide-binding universal stress UspA family protein
MYSRILVPVDGSATSRKGLDEAITLARLAGARLKLVHVIDELVLDSGYGPMAISESVIDAMREGGHKVLEDAVSLARKQLADVESELIETIGRRAADTIVDVAKQWQAELIVMGTHGRRGLRRLVMGSDAEAVLRTSPVPVLMVRAEEERAQAAA